MRKHLLISVSLFLGILIPYTSNADTSDCPENWSISSQNLSIKWDAGTKSFISNFGELFGLSEPVALSFRANAVSEKIVKKVSDLFGADFVEKLRAEGSNVGLRDVLAIEPTFSDLSKITDRTPLKRLPVSWNYSTSEFNTLNPSSLLRRGLLLEDIEGRKIKHFLEITKRGCSSVRVITSNNVVIPKSGISQSPIGMDEWTRGAENYLRAQYEIAEKRTVNWLTFDSNIKKFKEVLRNLESLPRSDDPPFEITAELKPVVWVGEDDLQFVPFLMGLPAKTCFWDSRNQNEFYYYLDTSVVLRSTPCRIVAIAPDYSNIINDSQGTWDSLVLVEVIDIPVRSKMTKSEAISIFQPIVNKLLSNKPDAGPKDVEPIFGEFKEEVQKLGITEFLIEGKNLIILVLNPKLAAVQKANEEAKAKRAAEDKTAHEEFKRKLSEGLIEPCIEFNQTRIVDGYEYGCVGTVEDLSWEQRERVSIPIPSPTISLVPDVTQPSVEESKGILLRPCSKLGQTVVLDSYKYTCVTSIAGLAWNQGEAVIVPRVTPTPSASPSLNVSPETKLDTASSAELKAKQEADAKAAAELKAKQEADAKAAAELKAKQEADAKAAAELKAKQEADAKAAADKAAGEKIISDAKAEAARILAAAKAAAAKKKTTITCVKGKLTKKVTAVKPVCPKGYKKK